MAKTEQVALDGVVWLRRHALADGLSDRAIARRVRSGEWHRVRRGAFTSGELWASLRPEDRHRVLCRAVLLTSHPASALSHVSAAVEWGADTWDFDLESVHLTRTDGKCGRRESGVIHHRGRLTEDEVAIHGGVRLTTAARAVAETCTIGTVESSLTVANSLLHAGKLQPHELHEQQVMTRSWPWSLNTTMVVRLADPRIESVAESRALHLFWREHIPKPVPQVDICDEAGRFVGRIDFAWPELGAFAEIDGKEKYIHLRRPGESLDEFLLREKRREEAICKITGWVCIRISWEDLARPRLLARRIRSILNARARSTA